MTNSTPSYVYEYNLYHQSADLMHPYKTFRIFTYSKFLPFSYLTYGMYSGLTSHTTSQNSSLIQSSKKVSAGSAVFRKPPVTSKMATSFCYIASIPRVAISASVEHVGECKLSYGFRYLICLLPFL